MQQLKRGDTLLKNGEEYKVSFANEDFVVFMLPDGEISCNYSYKELEESDYTLKKEKWVPGYDGKYFYYDFCYGTAEPSTYLESYQDINRKNLGNSFETAKECEAWGKKAVELLKTIK